MAWRDAPEHNKQVFAKTHASALEDKNLRMRIDPEGSQYLAELAWTVRHVEQLTSRTIL